jgi:tetratricopeptide (TPR) repeat protein
MVSRAGGRVLAIAVLALFAGAAAPPQAQWRRLDSPNFIVIGEVPAGDLRDVAVKFEGFRETLGRVLNERVTATAVPTVVLVFRGEATFTPFMPKFQGKRVDVGGLFVPRRDVNFIALVADGNDARFRVIFHEYAHLLVSNTGQRVPVWLNEGLAEYYSTFELQRGGRDAVIGRIIESHIQRLNETPLLKLPDLLNVTDDSPLYNEGNRRSVFYAQSWALTHLLFRSEPSRAPQLAAYLDFLSKGAASEEAWKRAFGEQDVARELETYIRRRAYTATLYKFTDKLASFEAQSAPVPPADVHAYLADFLVQRGEFDDAAAHLASATKLDPANPRAGLVAAMLDLAKQDFAGTEKRALVAGTADDWFLNYRVGVTLAAANEGRRAPPTAEDLETARRAFAKARADRPEFANALARMASLELRSAAGPTPETRAALERARSIAPGRHEYTMLLAQVLARQSEFAAARAALGPLMTPLYPTEVRESAKSLMAYVVELEARRSGASPSTSKTVSTPTSGNTGSSAVESESVTIPVFRDLRAGEQRLEGTLESIDCVQGKGVTFQIRSGAAVVPVTSRDLTSVEFLTYRRDLTGAVTCGPVKPAVPVYVTWRAGVAEGSRIAVAIEFLPKEP